MNHTILIRRQSVVALVVSFLFGIGISPTDTYSQVASAPNTTQPLVVDPNTAIDSRIREVPAEVIRTYIENGQIAPINHALTRQERRTFSAALKVLTPLQEAMLRKHLRSISFVEAMPANAQTVRVKSSGPDKAFDLVFNARVLGETLSEFATRKERQLFEAGDSELTVSVVAGSMDAVGFVLAHEATHIVDMVLGLTPPPTLPGGQGQNVSQTSFSRGVWESAMTPTSSYRGRVLDQVPQRTGTPLPIEKAQSLYEDLSRTPFVSVYASLMVVEDLAELVAWHQMTDRYRQPYRIEVRNHGGIVFFYEPMKSPLVRDRLKQLGIFDSKESESR